MHIGKEIKKNTDREILGMEYLCLVFLSTARAVLWYLSAHWGLLMGSCTWGHASLQGKKWDNENFKTHITGPRYYDTVKLPKRPRVDKFIELGRRCFFFLLCFWTTGIQQCRGTSLLSPHINRSETHCSDTLNRVTPTQGLRPPQAPQISQQEK